MTLGVGSRIEARAAAPGPATPVTVASLGGTGPMDWWRLGSEWGTPTAPPSRTPGRDATRRSPVAASAGLTTSEPGITFPSASSSPGTAGTARSGRQATDRATDRASTEGSPTDGSRAADAPAVPPTSDPPTNDPPSTDPPTTASEAAGAATTSPPRPAGQSATPEDPPSFEPNAPTPAPPVAPTGQTAGRGTPEERGGALLGSLGIDVASLIPGWSLRFLGADPGYRGSTFPGERRIEIYVRDDLTDLEVSHTIAHEVAHAIDVDRLDEAGRARWLRARGLVGLSWWAPSGVSDYGVGSGDFAESVAWVITGGGEWNSTVGAPPTAAQQRRLAELTPLG
ncbi:MAG: hypothetical protein R2704_04565 [Microthrixaceae bacterium]